MINVLGRLTGLEVSKEALTTKMYRVIKNDNKHRGTQRNDFRNLRFSNSTATSVMKVQLEHQSYPEQMTSYVKEVEKKNKLLCEKKGKE